MGSCLAPYLQHPAQCLAHGEPHQMLSEVMAKWRHGAGREGGRERGNGREGGRDRLMLMTKKEAGESMNK